MDIASPEPGSAEKPAEEAWSPYEDGGNDPDFYIPAARPGTSAVSSLLRLLGMGIKRT